MSERTGKENMRTTRNSASHHSSGRTSKKAMTRRQSDSPLDERESLDQLHEDDELNARTKAKRRRVVNAPVEEERRKTQTQSRRQAVRADEEDDVDMAVGNNDEEEDENTVEEDADEPFEQTASEQEEEENDAMEEVNCERNDENDDPDAARDVDGGDDEVQGAPTKMRTSSRSGLSRKSSPSSSSLKASLRRSSRVSSTVSDNGSTTSGNGIGNATRRKKRKGPSQHAKISSTSTQNLFQFTCRLLQSQKLEFEVRAREFEEKNARLAAERHKWEKKICGVKRQLQAYGHPVDGVDDGGTTSNGNGTGAENGVMLATNALDPRFRGNTNWNVTATTTALTTTGTMNGGNSGDTGSSNNTHLITMRDAFSSRTSAAASSSTSSGMDSLIPVSIHHMEAQIQDTLRLRRQQMNALMKDLHGIHGLNDKITRLR